MSDQMITLRGSTDFRKKLERFAEDMSRSSESLLAQQARALCVSYGAVTQPGGMGEMGIVLWEATIAKDIRKVFTKRENIAAVAAVIYRTNPALSHAFHRAATAGKNAQALKYLRQAGIRSEAVDPAVHRAARTAPKAHVPRNQIPQAVAKGPSLEAYIRKKQSLAGFAKAGWYAAAKALGGRVRRNVTDATTGKRSTVEIFPESVRKIARRFPGLGGALVTETRIEIWTNVRHARGAMDESLQAHAETIARESFTNALQKSLNAIVKKYFKRAA